MNKLHQQKGMTAIGWLLVLGLVAFFVLIVLRLVPLYLEYAKVASTLESVAAEPGVTNMSKSEIVNIITKRFDVNDVRNVDARKVQVSKDRGILKVGFSYERRQHLISNIDVVASFDKHVEVPIR